MVNSTKKYTPKAICRYCGDRRPGCYMTMVPTNAERLSRWIDILGPLFAENIQRYKSNFICRNHLNSPKNSRNRLPVSTQSSSSMVADKVKVKEELEEELSQENKKYDADCVEMVPPKCEVFDLEEFETEEKMHLEPEVQYLHMSNNINHNVQVKTSKKSSKKVCRYCETSCQQSEMTHAPSNPERLSEWIEILGPKFAQNVRKFKHPFICRSHLPKIREALSQLSQKKKNNGTLREEKIEESDEEVYEDLPQKMEDRDSEDVELLLPKSETLGVEKDDDFHHFTCRVCGARNNETMMTPIPTNPKILQKWSGILGWVFFENVLQNSAPHFVCMSHLKAIVEGLCQEE